ncbi:hypothetical protein [Prochlorococcus marinus]|uniref:hypothetical protein n=1 Tax=Prochlorococcus marinus TaxID=1219 RepID=UPI0022B5463D|nr:hypothetical protein [Prochlorococcus marinus]
MKSSLLSLIAGVLRTIADSLEKRQEDVDAMPDVDVMADVDDQRAHHFRDPKVLGDFE